MRSSVQLERYFKLINNDFKQLRPVDLKVCLREILDGVTVSENLSNYYHVNREYPIRLQAFDKQAAITFMRVVFLAIVNNREAFLSAFLDIYTEAGRAGVALQYSIVNFLIAYPDGLPFSQDAALWNTMFEAAAMDLDQFEKMAKNEDSNKVIHVARTQDEKSALIATGFFMPKDNRLASRNEKFNSLRQLSRAVMILLMDKAPSQPLQVILREYAATNFSELGEHMVEDRRVSLSCG